MVAVQVDGYGAYDAIRPLVLRHLEQENFTQALALLTNLARALPMDPGLLQDMAQCHWGLGDHEGAMQLIGAAA